MPRPAFPPAALLALLAAVLVLGWWWPNRPQAGDVPMPATRFNSLSYTPYRAGQSPRSRGFPPRAEVDADLALLAGHTRAIRTYAADEGNYDIAALARAHGLKLWQGIWLGADRARNAREIARGIAVANAYPDVVERVVVGNEVLLRRDLPPAELDADLDRVRAAVRQPVTYADVWEFWERFPEIARHVDIVTVHLLPYWEDDPTGIDRAMAHVDATYRRMAALFPGERVAIGEAGWPSRGRWRRDAAPGRVNQAVFLRRFIALSQREGFDYNLIEAFDQNWKHRDEGTVGANWGLWTADRTAKFPFSGPVSEDPAWPWHAALSVLAGLLLLAGAWRDGLTPGGGRVLAVLAMALGGALGFAWAGTTPVLYDLPEHLAAAADLCGQALLAALLAMRAAACLAGECPAPSGAAALGTTRGSPRALPSADALLDGLALTFLCAAAVLQALLLLDPRYRDFPLPQFAVPLVATLARAALRDLSRGGRAEIWAGGALALCALAGAVREGSLNRQAMAWCLMALILSAPPLLRRRPARGAVGSGAPRAA